MTSSFSETSVFKVLFVHNKTKRRRFQPLSVEERFRKPPFSSWRISVDGRPSRGKKAALSNCLQYMVDGRSVRKMPAACLDLDSIDRLFIGRKPTLVRNICPNPYRKISKRELRWHVPVILTNIHFFATHDVYVHQRSLLTDLLAITIPTSETKVWWILSLHTNLLAQNALNWIKLNHNIDKKNARPVI